MDKIKATKMVMIMEIIEGTVMPITEVTTLVTKMQIKTEIIEETIIAIIMAII